MLILQLCTAIFKLYVSFPAYLYSFIMEFKQEELVEREIEIGGYLLQNCSLKMIADKIGISKKIVAAHIGNMMVKLKAENMEALIKLLKHIEQ